ncbi:MAG: endonuclease V [Thermodesulfobacteriota bacterium]
MIKVKSAHSWKVSPDEAKKIQLKLRQKLLLCPPPEVLTTIAAGDVAYSSLSPMTYAAFLLFTYPELDLIEKVAAAGEVTFPYIPTLLTFREAPPLLQAFHKLSRKPDLIIFDGQGIAHPCSMGIAAHLGIILNLPTIGCAKSCLVGTYEHLPSFAGAHVPLLYKDQVVGMVVRTRANVQPVFISPGHKMDLENALKIILSLCRGYRIPEPVRQAHIFVNQLRIQGKLRERNLLCKKES